MKEATGEASNTVIVIVLIAAIAAVAFFIVNAMNSKIQDNVSDINSYDKSAATGGLNNQQQSG